VISGVVFISHFIESHQLVKYLLGGNGGHRGIIVSGTPLGSVGFHCLRLYILTTFSIRKLIHVFYLSFQ
jgi:hypothetical protein